MLREQYAEIESGKKKDIPNQKFDGMFVRESLRRDTILLTFTWTILIHSLATLS